jgi:hypothetical protein
MLIRLKARPIRSFGAPKSTGSVCYGGDREAPGPGALCLDHLHNGHYAEPEGLE